MKNSPNLEKHVGYWLRFVSNHVSQAFANKLAAYGVSVAEWVVLNVLGAESQSPAVIAKKIGMSRGAISKVLEKLFLKQLINRLESAEDRRYLEITLSKKGLKLIPKLQSIADENDDYYFGHLSPSDKKEVLKLLMEIVARNQWKDIPIS